MSPLLVAAVVFAVALLLLERRRRADDPARRIARLVERRTTAAPPLDAGPSRSERALVRLPGWERFGRLLEQAGVERSPFAVAWLAAGAILLALLLGAAVGGAGGAFALLALLAVGARLDLWRRATRRRRLFDEQLPDVLAEVGSGLRAGHGFLQALQAVVADAPAPIGPELERVLAETRLGRSLEDALVAAGGRVRSEAFEFVIDAVVVQRQVGGSLAGIFDIVGESVRQRQQFELKVRALTANGRMSAAVLLALPLLIACGLSALNHHYLSPLFATASGRIVLLVGVGLMGLGWLWLNRLVSGVER